MAAKNSSIKHCTQKVNTQSCQKTIQSARLFASKVLSILESSQNSLRSLFKDIDHINLEQESNQVQPDNQNKNEQQQKNQGIEMINLKSQGQHSTKSIITEPTKNQNNVNQIKNNKNGFNQIQNDQNSLNNKDTTQQKDENQPIQNNQKTVFLGNLSQQKQALMRKLRQVDRKIFQARFGQGISSINKVPRHSPNTKKLKQISNTKKEPVATGDRTLEIMKNFNNQKIRRHEEVLKRMKKRQQEEMRKIQQLQSHNYQIQLKKSQTSRVVKALKKPIR